VKLLPVWAQALIVLIGVSLIFGAGFKVASWRASGELATAEAERDAAILERDEKREFARVCAEDLAAEKLKLTNMDRAMAELNRIYEEAVNQPPERVVIYRDRWHDAPDVITSADCPEAVGQLVEYLQTLPAFGGGS
jgi:hypothetical protein